MVPTVDLGDLETVFCSIAITDLAHQSYRHQGLSFPPINCLAYAENVSM